MKNKLLLLACLGFAGKINAQTTSPAPYCEARIDQSTLYYNNVITAVHIGTLSNVTGTVYSGGADYIYYNNLPAVNLQKGTTITPTFFINRFDMEMDVFWVYIDYNINNVFEPGELVGQAPAGWFTGPASAGTNIPISFPISIPATAQTGQTRMRLMYTSDNGMWSVTTPTACNSNTSSFSGPTFLYGEVEDYDVMITGGSVVSAPVASFTMADHLCTGQTYTLTDNSTNTPTAWSWTLSGGTPSTSAVQNPAVKYNSPGTYTVLFSSSNAGGSSAVVAKTVTVTACTGIGEQSLNDTGRLSLYPNPGTGYFNIDGGEAVKIMVYNVCGVKLLEQDLESGKHILDLHEQPRGIYFLTAYGKGFIKSLKLIKE